VRPHPKVSGKIPLVSIGKFVAGHANPALPPWRRRTVRGEDRDFFVARGRNTTILHRLFIARSRRF
jgi:hypothetical protein